MRVVLDTSAIIYLNDFRLFDEIFTVSNVVDEVKDKINTLKLSGLSLKIIDPSESSVKDIKEIAEKTGDLEKLSSTDIKVLALAKEKSLSIVSDDYSIQNVAEKIGLSYISLFNKKITNLIQWENYCENCKKFYDGVNTCPKCGSHLVRKPVGKEFIRTKNN